MLNQGYWRPITATIDWCEPNYVLSPYVAEFFNTLSNLPFILFGLYSLYKFRNVEMRFKVAFLSLIFVGIGSFIFHMTLTWTGQLLDEISMLFGSASILYILLEHDKRRSNKMLAFALTLFVILFSLFYIKYHYALLFQSVWVLTVAVDLTLFYKLCKNSDQLEWFYFVTTVLGISAACWLFEQITCNYIPFVQFLGLHAFIWHIGTAYVSAGIIHTCRILRTIKIK